MSEANVKFKEFEIPKTFFDKLYEFTGSGESTRGFVLCYISNKDEPVVRCALSNPIVELALLKTMQDYVKSQETMFGGKGGTEENSE
jgi:hypothetical protein